jgi:hypothetical protein
MTDSGGCYEPGEHCRDSDHGMSGVAGDGETITCEDNDGWRWDQAKSVPGLPCTDPGAGLIRVVGRSSHVPLASHPDRSQHQVARRRQCTRPRRASVRIKAITRRTVD